MKGRDSNLCSKSGILVKNDIFCKLYVQKDGIKCFWNGSKFDMQLFFKYIKRYSSREDNFENFFQKRVPLMYASEKEFCRKLRLYWRYFMILCHRAACLSQQHRQILVYMFIFCKRQLRYINTYSGLEADSSLETENFQLLSKE